MGEDILYRSEMIIRLHGRDKNYKQILNLCNQIKNTYMEVRTLLRKYESNIEHVDPQLKNNLELVECIQNFEIAWENGKLYLSSNKDIEILINFTTIVEDLKES